MVLCVYCFSSTYDDKLSFLEKVFHTETYFSVILMVKIIFTTATPLKMADYHVATPADCPEHLFCNVDNLSLFTNILLAVNLNPNKFIRLRTITLLVPLCYQNSRERYAVCWISCAFWVLYLNRFVSQVAQALNGLFKPTHLSKFLTFSSFVGHNYSSEKIVREVFNFFYDHHTFFIVLSSVDHV